MANPHCEHGCGASAFGVAIAIGVDARSGAAVRPADGLMGTERSGGGDTAAIGVDGRGVGARTDAICADCRGIVAAVVRGGDASGGGPVTIVDARSSGAGTMRVAPGSAGGGATTVCAWWRGSSSRRRGSIGGGAIAVCAWWRGSSGRRRGSVGGGAIAVCATCGSWPRWRGSVGGGATAVVAVCSGDGATLVSAVWRSTRPKPSSPRDGPRDRPSVGRSVTAGGRSPDGTGVCDVRRGGRAGSLSGRSVVRLGDGARGLGGVVGPSSASKRAGGRTSPLGRSVVTPTSGRSVMPSGTGSGGSVSRSARAWGAGSGPIIKSSSGSTGCGCDARAGMRAGIASGGVDVRDGMVGAGAGAGGSSGRGEPAGGDARIGRGLGRGHRRFEVGRVAERGRHVLAELVGSLRLDLDGDLVVVGLGGRLGVERAADRRQIFLEVRAAVVGGDRRALGRGVGLAELEAAAVGEHRDHRAHLVERHAQPELAGGPRDELADVARPVHAARELVLGVVERELVAVGTDQLDDPVVHVGAEVLAQGRARARQRPPQRRAQLGARRDVGGGGAIAAQRGEHAGDVRDGRGAGARADREPLASR